MAAVLRPAAGGPHRLSQLPRPPAPATSRMAISRQASKPGSGRRGVVNGRWSAERAHFKLPQASFLRIVECRAHNRISSPLSEHPVRSVYEGKVGTGDAPSRHSRSAANLQLLWAALLSKQVVGRPNQGNNPWAEKYAICPLCAQAISSVLIRGPSPGGSSASWFSLSFSERPSAISARTRTQKSQGQSGLVVHFDSV